MSTVHEVLKKKIVLWNLVFHSNVESRYNTLCRDRKGKDRPGPANDTAEIGHCTAR